MENVRYVGQHQHHTSLEGLRSAELLSQVLLAHMSICTGVSIMIQLAEVIELRISTTSCASLM